MSVRRNNPRYQITVEPEIFEPFMDEAKKRGIEGVSRALMFAAREWLVRQGGKPTAPPRLRVDPKGRGKSSVHISLPEQVGQAVAKYARRKGFSTAQVLREAVMLHIRDHLGDQHEFRDIEEWRWIADESAPDPS